MNSLKKTFKAKLFVSLIFLNKDVLLSKIIPSLTHFYGDIDHFSDFWNFDSTQYYEREMGSHLQKCFLSFKNLIEQYELGCIKKQVQELEDQYRDIQGHRTVNIDPGYITDAKVILSSGKDYSHRICLDQNIYAEVTLSFSKKGILSHPWTYPDYRSHDYQQYFSILRETYMKQKKTLYDC